MTLQQDLKDIQGRLAVLEQKIDEDQLASIVEKLMDGLLVQKLARVLGEDEDDDVEDDTGFPPTLKASDIPLSESDSIKNNETARNSPRKEIENIIHAKVQVALKQELDDVTSYTSQKIKDFVKEEIKGDDDDISFDESIQDDQNNQQEQQDHADVENQASLVTNSREKTQQAFQHDRNTSSNNLQTASALSQNGVNDASRPFQTELCQDSYSLMILSVPFKTCSWWFAATVFALQFLLLCLFIYGQIFQNSDRFIPPINNTLPVAMAQFLAIIVALLMTTDLIESAKCINILLMGSFADSNCQSVLSSSVGYSSREEMQRIIKTSSEKNTQKLYRRMVLLPNILKFVQGLLALVTSFIIIIQSSDVIDLFKGM